MTSRAAAFSVPVSLAAFDTQTFAHYRDNTERPMFSSVYHTNAQETFVCSRSLSSIAEEHSHHHQRDSILPGGRNGILNGTCSEYDCIFKPLLDPSPSQHILITLALARCFLLQSSCSHSKDTPPHPTPPLKSNITDSASGKFSSLAHWGVTLDLSGICFVYKLIAITGQLICHRG